MTSYTQWNIAPEYIALFFISVSLIPVLFMTYIIAVVREDDPKIPTYFWMNAIPYALYLAFVLSNPVTGLLYHIDESNGFTYGDGFFLTYVIPVLYMIATIFIIFSNRKRIEKPMRRILLSFPIMPIRWRVSSHSWNIVMTFPKIPGKGKIFFLTPR